PIPKSKRSADNANTVIFSGNTGILNGNQVYAPVQSPINLCGIAISIPDDSSSGCQLLNPEKLA
ncbi:8668_t:CDS:1, partial [Ambispora gerdemannii]